MEVMGEQVHHKNFGDGCITSQSDTTITVAFDENYGIKRFLYPSAFEDFLTLTNPTLQEKQKNELAQKSAEAEAARTLKRQEEERRLQEAKAALKSPKRAVRRK